MRILGVAHLRGESVRLNVLKRCPRIAQAMNGSCACACFVIIAQTHVAPVLSPKKDGER